MDNFTCYLSMTLTLIRPFPICPHTLILTIISFSGKKVSLVVMVNKQEYKHTHLIRVHVTYMYICL